MSDSELNELRRRIEELSLRVARLEQKAHPQPTSSFSSAHQLSASSLESRLGSQYLNRAGIVALLVGASYFLHLAFTNNWIGSSLRVLIGIVGGIAVILLGQIFQRRGYAAFGLSLKALGLGVLYLSVWAGFQLYHFVSTPVAAAAMVAITVSAVAMALRQQSEALAALAFTGGFATPILLYTGENLYLELFVYLLLLSAAMLLLVRERPWKNLLLVSFVGYISVTLSWYWEFFRQGMRIEFAIFCTFVLAIFMTASLSVVLRSRITPMISIVTIGSAAFYLFAIRGALHVAGSVLLVLVGVSFLLITWRQSPLVHAAGFTMGVTYCAAAVPIGLETHWTTSAVWLAMGTLLLVFGFAKHATSVRWTALALIGITVVKVFISDLSRLEQAYRVLAATILGVTLLAISFAYQRYRVTASR
jgi:uncharacterized membrane protein